MLPQLPDWTGIHPLVIHFPIALLLVAPLLVALGLAVRNGRRAYLVSALILMALGTLGAYIAVSTGEAAGEIAEQTAGAEGLLEQHEELAEAARTVFTALTALFAALVAIPWLRKKEPQGRLFLAAHVAFLLLYVGGAVVLVNAAHLGGRLVHEAGVRAQLTPQTPATAAPSRTAEPSDEEEEEAEADD
jgi:uncharacterized membrane protein